MRCVCKLGPSFHSLTIFLEESHHLRTFGREPAVTPSLGDHARNDSRYSEVALSSTSVWVLRKQDSYTKSDSGLSDVNT